VNSHDAVDRGRELVLEHFRWIDGAADTWSMFRSADALAGIVAGLAALIEDARPDVVIGIESRGFVLAPAVALTLGVGFAPVRKDGALFPGPLVERTTDGDYRGNRRTLSARRDLFAPGQRVVLVDDWVETGSQALAAVQLVTDAGADLVGVAVVVDEASPTARAALPMLWSLVRSSELESTGRS
jgi:adenine phosphoribosyltransferase